MHELRNISVFLLSYLLSPFSTDGRYLDIKTKHCNMAGNCGASAGDMLILTEFGRGGYEIQTATGWKGLRVRFGQMEKKSLPVQVFFRILLRSVIK